MMGKATYRLDPEKRPIDIELNCILCGGSKPIDLETFKHWERRGRVPLCDLSESEWQAFGFKK